MQTRQNLFKLKTMASKPTTVCRISPDGGRESISSDDLVPGDVIEVQNNSVVPCDVLLLSGECAVNESLLTGESIPQIKRGLPNSRVEMFHYERANHHMLYSGTKVMQVKKTAKAIGLCVRTAFDTAKGRLILSILYPREANFKYHRDSMRFIAILFLIST